MRGEKYLGMVEKNDEGEPHFWPDKDNFDHLTFGDMDIIQDCWKEMQEQNQKSAENPLDRFTFCDEKHP